MLKMKTVEGRTEAVEKHGASIGDLSAKLAALRADHEREISTLKAALAKKGD